MKITTLNIGFTAEDATAQRQARALAPVAPAAALATLPVPVLPPLPPKPKMSLERAAMLGLEIPAYRDVTEETLGTVKKTVRQNQERIVEASDALGSLAECSVGLADSTTAKSLERSRKARTELARRYLLQGRMPSNIAADLNMDFAEVERIRERLGIL